MYGARELHGAGVVVKVLSNSSFHHSMHSGKEREPEIGLRPAARSAALKGTSNRDIMYKSIEDFRAAKNTPNNTAAKWLEKSASILPSLSHTCFLNGRGYGYKPAEQVAE